MITIFVWAVFLVAFVSCTYLGVLTIAALFYSSPKRKSHLISMVIVIPAHNEENQILAAIQGARSIEYPEQLCKVVVIADNCSDQTAVLAQKAGVEVYERIDHDLPGKGRALDWYLRTERDSYRSFEGLTIIDADTYPDKNFLKELSYSLSHPEVDVVQGYYSVSNPKDSWLTALTTAALILSHDLRPRGRSAMGGTAGLKGNGMGFRTDLLMRVGWPCHSIVEDLELSLYLLDRDIKVVYNPDACVYGEMPICQDQAKSQRRRWEAGRLELARKYVWELFRKSVLEGRFSRFDALMDLATPPLSIVALLALVLTSFTLNENYQYLQMAAVCNGVFLAFYVFSGLIMRKAPLYVWLGLVFSPLFILFKFLVFTKVLFSRKQGWTRTKRKTELD